MSRFELPSKLEPQAETVAKLIVFVALYHRDHDEGPLWKECCAAIGRPPYSAGFTYMMLGLRKRGFVTFDDGVARSLQVGPGALRWAVDLLRERQAAA